MSDFEFADPGRIHLVWLAIGFVIVLIVLDRRGSRGVNQLLSVVMQQRLVWRPRGSRRLMRIGLLGLSSLGLILALMRPQSGLHAVNTPQVGAQIMVCLALSKSMLAADIAPNRLARAKAEIEDLLVFLERDHVGLIGFAGRATVLCPLTPDFGFLRQRLNAASPYRVARGGTNLETPIRKAVAGFRGQSDLSRVVILITDGEDHDSFAMEAAKEAAERGIRIIAIGFGDEAGSELYVSDPKTGARTAVLDGDGNPVVTHLDGDLLRRIALETEGVYIPAGTGVLDLQSIYSVHIAPLIRGSLSDHSRLVKQEQYQWAVLLSLVSLVAAGVVAGRPSRRDKKPAEPHPSSLHRMGVTAALMVALLIAGGAHAQGPAVEPDKPLAQVADDPDTSEPSGLGEDGREAVDARQTYNRALAMLASSDLDKAESQFALARWHAGSDALARFRSTYNLGWVEIKRTDQLIEDQPEEALTHLHAAADWFREAVRLDPNDSASRVNLQIVTRRALALADALNKHAQGDLGTQLDDLVDQQRQMTVRLQETVQRVSQLDTAIIPDHLRSEFRNLEVAQRKVLSSVHEVAEYTHQESEELEKTDQGQRTSEQRVRLVQIRAVQAYLYQAGQRISQTRRHLRTRQAKRAYRRASVALGQLKRARDQLRDLVEVLGAVIDDAEPLTRQTAALAESVRLAVAVDGQPRQIPHWLTRKYLQDSLETVRGRADELIARVEVGLGRQETEEDEDPSLPPLPGSPSEPPSAQAGGDREQLRALFTEAAPLMRLARNGFEEASLALASQRDQDAYMSEAQATSQLLKARELFLDIRGLIELMYTDQKRMAAMVEVDDSKIPFGELLPLMRELQSANRKRASRLSGLLEGELEKLAATALATGEESGPDKNIHAETPPQVQQRLILAKQVLSLATDTFDQTQATILQLTESEETADKNQPFDTLRQEAALGIEQLEALRRLFFSIVEHLRETLRRQVGLSDDTRDAATITEQEQIASVVGPLVSRQDVLSDLAQQIAESLESHSQQVSAASTAGQGSVPPTVGPDSQDQAHRMLQASQRVDEAKIAMDQAINQLNGPPVAFDATQEFQAAAIQNLAKALELLEPAPPPQDPQQGEDQDKSQSQAQEGQEGENEDAVSGLADMAHLLQALRDRQARRERQRRRQPTGYAPVEKDW